MQQEGTDRIQHGGRVEFTMSGCGLPLKETKIITNIGVKMSDPLEQELQTVVSCHVGAGN